MVKRTLRFASLDEATFDDIPSPALPGSHCQTCDYWERLDGRRAAPPPEAGDASARRSLKRGRLLAAVGLAGSYGMVVYAPDDTGTERPIGYVQFGPLSAYPRAQVIRDRYPQLPDSPAPWVITCLQVAPDAGGGEERIEVGRRLLDAACDELDRRGVTAVEAYPEPAEDSWLPSSGPAAVYEASRFARVAGDDRYPAYRRELTGETDVAGWDELVRRSRPDEEQGWPLPARREPTEEDLFRLPEKPKRPNPFGDD